MEGSIEACSWVSHETKAPEAPAAELQPTTALKECSANPRSKWVFRSDQRETTS